VSEIIKKFRSHFNEGVSVDSVIRILLCFSLLNLINSTSVYTQQEISGVINKYTSVESVTGSQTITVSNPDFSAGDTVLLIQMKGMGILTNPPSDYGRQQNLNNSGNYEILLIDNVNGNEITFTRELIKEYNAFETLQLIKVRGYESARVTGTLTAPPWDGEKGGVLALIVTNTLTLEADIDLSGAGFRGGDPVTTLNGNCAETDPVKYDLMSYPAGTNIAGNKGEGPATYYTDADGNIFPAGNDFVQGKGRLATGGGGGNGRFSGGGGGSNYGQGSFGGGESADCPEFSVETEGIGGYRMSDLLRTTGGDFVNRLFLGGAGGGSTQHGTRIATKGGNGGGIVLIIANYIEGSQEYGIISNGEGVLSEATAGAGGGGGGGTIVASIDNYSGTINLSATGGKGGDIRHPVIAGPGGGGGGGAIIHSGNTLPSSVNTILTQGTGGINIEQGDPNGSANGSPGGLIEGLEVVLNGLLFNGIKTARKLICEETAPDILEGTQPRGGLQPYIYEWFKKTEGTGWEQVAGANQMHFQPGPLNETTRFLRVVKDQDVVQVVDSSNQLLIEIQPKITGNIIGAEQTICEGDTPLLLTGEIPVPGEPGQFQYAWVQSYTSGNEWNSPANEAGELNYQPGALSDSVLFLRIASYGVCTDSSNVVPVNVHPLIINNILDTDQTICSGSNPAPVSAPLTVDGALGPNSYTYSWELGINDLWNPVTGGNQADYDPGPISQTIRVRRTVQSGMCSDISLPHTINVLPTISGNIISDNQTICYLSAPELFTGTDPAGGDGYYDYLWETSDMGITWSSAEGINDEKNFLSAALSGEIYIRRIILSGDNAVCKDTSNLVFVGLHPLSSAGITETSDTICAGEQSELTFTLNGEGPWNLIFTNGTEDYTLTGIEGPTQNYSITPNSSDSTTHQYVIKSLTDRFGCNTPSANFSGKADVRVYAYPDPDPGFDGEICGLGYDLNATLVFGRGMWESTSAAQFSPRPDSPHTRVTVEEYGSHEFKWSVTNWQCPASKEISVTFYEKPDGVNAGADQTLQFLFETNLNAELPDNMPSAYGIWSLEEGSGNIVFPESPGSLVTDMGFGNNTFLWTLHNGVCEPKSAGVTVFVQNLVAPTGFSPNNSGLNDRFVITGLENSRTNELTIFNRQGGVVFRTTDYRNDWEGKNQDGIPLPEDTYYYILYVNNSLPYKGFIVLKR
jgi:gliding motility-associated-like protein